MNVLAALLGLAPDADPATVGVLTACLNAVPSIRGMKGAPSPISAGMATLAGTCQGAALATKLDGSNRLFAGTGKALYEASGSTWSDVSRAATYTGGSTAKWRFAQQEDVSLAANGSDTVQASASAGAFSCVAGAPVAAIVETANKFVFAANLSSGSNKIAWSALGDYTDWTASVSTQSGSTSLTDTPGGITALRRFGSTVMAFKKNSMYLGTYSGPPTIWEFDLVPGSAGAMSQESVVNIGTPENPKLVFIGEDDFYLFDGSKPVPIGTNRLRNTVFNSLEQSRYYACAALHVKDESQVYFWYPTTDSPNPDSCVVYNYKTDKWGRADRMIETAVDYVTGAVTFDQLGSLYSTFDDFPNAPFDLAFIGSSKPVPAIVDTTHSIKTLTGPCVSSSITTGDFGDDEEFSTVTNIMPRFITAPTDATLTHFYKNNSGDSLTQGATTSLSSFGQWFDLLWSARWHRLQFNFTGDWEMAAIKPTWERGETR